MKTSQLIILLFLLCSCLSHAKDKACQLTIRVDETELFNHVNILTTTARPRNFRNIESIDSAANYIRGTLTKYGFSPTDQEFDAHLDYKYRNICAVVGPANTERIVVGAHYDVCSNQPGADDNASGVSGLLELARLAKLNEKCLPHQIEFVAYSLEEPPFYDTEKMGSFVHAQDLKKNGIRIKYMLCLEMIGYYSKTQEYPIGIMKLFFPKNGYFIASIGPYGSGGYVRKLSRSINKNAEIQCVDFTAPQFFPGIMLSDHRNYTKMGYKAFMLNNTAFHRDMAYHTTDDRINRIDFARMAEVVKGAAYFLLSN